MGMASDLKCALDRALDSPAATAAVMVVLLAMPVMASTHAGGAGSREAPRFEAYQPPLQQPYNYHMRCWQHSRLVSEELISELPDDRHPLTVSGSDRDGHPVFVAQDGHATCLGRSIPTVGAWPHR